MKYSLIKSSKHHKEKILEYKLKSILEYAEDLSRKELIRIEEYVKKHVMADFKNYKMIEVENKIVGCLFIEKQEDGILIDEIYLEENYRNKGIGSNILKHILHHNNVVYLWVYKRNTKAISLYKRMDFIVIEETETRYYMRHGRESLC